jgi:trans-aconitate methyltransferase
MIKKAKSIDPTFNYSCADLMTWNPNEKVDLVHSMEVFYYLDNPKELIQKISNQWLNTGGRLIIGLDFYFENTVSHDWSESCGISNMKLYSENEWVDFFKAADFESVEYWRFGAKKNWVGTLIVTGIK